MEEKVSDEFKLNELTRKNFRHTIDQLHDQASSTLLLTLQWKEIEDYLNSAELSIENRATELRSILEKRELELDQKERYLELVQENINVRFKEVEEREVEVAKLKEEVELARVSVEKKLSEVNEKEKLCEKSLCNLKLKEDVFSLKVKEFEEKRGSVDLNVESALREISEKEKLCQRILNELELKEDEFRLRVKEFDERLECDDLIESKLREISDTEISCERILNELELKEDEFRLRVKGFEKRLESEDLIESKLREINDKEKSCERILNELKLKEDEFRLREKQFEDKQKFDEVKVWKLDGDDELTNKVRDNVKDDGACIQLCLSVSMNGMELQMYLNEQCEDHDRIRKDLSSALQVSSNPGKVVLDAMQGFYPPRLKKGELEFDEVVVRKSCIFLLELLMEIKPQVLPSVKEEAMKLYDDWRARIMTESENAAEVLGCLLLLCSYGLASAFDANVLLSYLAIVAQYRRARELLHNLGLADKVSGFLQNLVAKNRHIEAIRFIYAFELFNEFPPVPLLIEYVEICRGGIAKSKLRNKSIQNRIEATKKLVDDMKAALRCIEDCKIESEVSTKCLKQQISCLENANKSRKEGLLVRGCKSGSPNKDKMCFASNFDSASVDGITPNVALSPTTTSTSVVIPALSQKQSGKKRPWSVVAEDDQDALSVHSASVVNSIQTPSQEPAVLAVNQDHIQGLIERNQRIEAIMYIYKSGMVDKYSVVHLLRDHIIYLKNMEKKFSHQKNYPIKSQIGFIANHIARLKRAIKCTKRYNLQCEFSPKDLQECVARMEKQLEEKRRVLECFKSQTEPLKKSEHQLQQPKKNERKFTVGPSNAAPVKTTKASQNTVASDPSKIVTSPSSVGASSLTPMTPSLPHATIVCAAAPTTLVSSPAPVEASSAPPANSATVITPCATSTTLSSSVPKGINPKSETENSKPEIECQKQVTPPSLSVATSSSSVHRTKKPKLERESQKSETKNQKQAHNKPPVKAASLGKPRNSSITAAYHPQPAGQLMYNGVPALCYHNVAVCPPSNAHFDPYYAHNPYYRLDGQRHSDSSYYCALPPRRW